MGNLINFIVKISGFGWVWEKLDGLKTYLAAAVSILTGIVGIIQEFRPALDAHDAATVWSLIQGLPNDQSWLMIVAGLGILGIGHKLEKAAGVAEPSPPISLAAISRPVVSPTTPEQPT